MKGALAGLVVWAATCAGAAATFPCNLDLQYTVYRGANLLRAEVIAKTEEPSVAYKYEGGLSGFSAPSLQRIAWQDVNHQLRTVGWAGVEADRPVVLRARNRLAVAEGDHGSIAFFPPPHQFFFARQLEVNLGYVWYRKGREGTTIFTAISTSTT